MKPIVLTYQHRALGLRPKTEDGCITTPIYLTGFRAEKEPVGESVDILCLFYSCVMVYKINFLYFEFYENGNLNNPVDTICLPIQSIKDAQKQINHLCKHESKFISELFFNSKSNNG